MATTDWRWRSACSARAEATISRSTIAIASQCRIPAFGATSNACDPRELAGEYATEHRDRDRRPGGVGQVVDRAVGSPQAGDRARGFRVALSRRDGGAASAAAGARSVDAGGGAAR